MIRLFLDYPWLASVVYAVLVTAQAVGLKAAGTAWLARGHIRFQYEDTSLNPFLQHDVSKQRAYYRRNLGLALVPTLFMWLIGYVLKMTGDAVGIWLYQCVLGFMMTGALVIIHQLIRELIIMSPDAVAEGMAGQIRYSSWLSVRMAGIEMLRLAVVLGIVALLLPHPFLIGGTLCCVTSGAAMLVRARQFRRRARTTRIAPPSEEARDVAQLPPPP